MSSVNDSTKDLLGQSVQIKFHVPVGDNAQFQYDAVFGLGSNLTVKDGLVVTGPTPIKLYAAFKGQLFFSPSPFTDLADPLLALCIVPAEVLALSTLLPAGAPSPSRLVYFPVNQAEVEKAIAQTLAAQGLAGAQLKDTQKAYLAGEVGVLVDAGAWIGMAPAGSVTVRFEDEDGYALHPRYLLWLFWKSAGAKTLVFEPTNHGLVAALQLAGPAMTLEDGAVTMPGSAEAEPYSLAGP